MSGVLRDGLSAGSIPPQDEREKVSRRAVLGAAVGFPLVSDSVTSSFRRKPESISSGATEGRWIPDQVRDDDRWEQALADFRDAEAAVREIEAATAGCGYDEEAALLPAHDAACEAMGAALGRVLRAPVADPAAFAVKLELFFELGVEPHSVDAAVAAAIRGDSARLAGWSSVSG